MKNPASTRTHKRLLLAAGALLFVALAAELVLRAWFPLRTAIAEAFAREIAVRYGPE